MKDKYLQTSSFKIFSLDLIASSVNVDLSVVNAIEHSTRSNCAAKKKKNL